VPRRPSDRRLAWGDGWVEERTLPSGVVRHVARWREPESDRKPSKAFATRVEAEAFLRGVSDRIASGRYVEPSRLTVAELVERWIERSVPRWSQATAAAYDQRLRHLIRPHIGTVRCGDLDAPRVQAWIDTLVRRKVAASTIRSAHSVLDQTYQEAVRLGIVERNPADGVQLPSKRKPPRNVWTADEARRAVAYFADDPQWSAAIRLQLATAMRPGEVAALRWADVDLPRGRLAVRRTITRDRDHHVIIGDTPKNGRTRTIALPDAVVEALTRWRKVLLERRLAAVSWVDQDLVFPNECGGVLSQPAWQRRLDWVHEQTGVKRLHPHELRHTGATLMLERGVHPKIVSEILGHASIQITLDVYSHVSVDLQRQAIDALAGDLFGSERTGT
jgi:integrase